MTNLLKSPAQALEQVKNFTKELQALQTKYFFTEMHAADEDMQAGVLLPLYNAEKASMVLLDRLVEMNNKKSIQGCKVKGASHAI